MGGDNPDFLRFFSDVHLVSQRGKCFMRVINEPHPTKGSSSLLPGAADLGT